MPSMSFEYFWNWFKGWLCCKLDYLKISDALLPHVDTKESHSTWHLILIIILTNASCTLTRFQIYILQRYGPSDKTTNSFFMETRDIVYQILHPITHDFEQIMMSCNGSIQKMMTIFVRWATCDIVNFTEDHRTVILKNRLFNSLMTPAYKPW